ncbi:MAG: PAS domain S-box protein [Bacteroidales bacterium]|nr:PAS domain S-box protein [Bacteroidales bacterium]
MDITEIKRHEDILMDFNEKLGNIIDLIPDPTFVIDNSKKVTHWNLALEELTGTKKNKVIGSNIYAKAVYGENRPMLVDLIDEDDENIKAFYKRAKRIKDKIYAEFEIKIPADNKMIYLWAVAAPLYDKNNNRFGSIELVKDITDIKNHEIELFESEEKARVLLNNNLNITMLIQTDGRIIDCNAPILRILNKSKKEIVGNFYQNYLPNEVKSEIEEYVQSALYQGNDNASQTVNYNDQFYNLSVYPVKDNLGKINRLVISANDITLMKNTEKELSEKEEQYRTITTIITDYVYKIYYRNNQVTYSFENPGLEKIIGYKPSELEPVYRGSVEHLIHPADRDFIEKSFIEIIHHKKPYPLEHRLIHKNGNIIWISTTFIFSKDHPLKGIELLCVLKDITEKKKLELTLHEAEERYRIVFEQSGLASNVFDLSGNLIMQNQLAKRILGRRNEDYIGKSIEEVLYPPFIEYTKHVFSKTLAQGYFYDERKFKIDKYEYWLKIISQTIKNEHGENQGVQIITQNISERKEQEIRILKTMIETEEKEKAYFSQEIHDSLGPLLSSIKMYIQWLGRPDAKAPKEEILSDTEKLIDESITEIREIAFKLSPHILTNFGLLEAIKMFSKKISKPEQLTIEITR